MGGALSVQGSRRTMLTSGRASGVLGVAGCSGARRVADTGQRDGPAGRPYRSGNLIRPGEVASTRWQRTATACGAVPPGSTRWSRLSTSAKRWTRSATTSWPARRPRTALNRLLRRGHQWAGRPGLAAPPGTRAGPRTAPRRPARRHPEPGTRAARPGARAGAHRAVPEPGRLGPDGRGGARRAARRHLPRRTPARRIPVDAPHEARGRPTSRSRSCCARRCWTRSSPACGTRWQNATPEDLARIREMMGALNDMLDADARGEHTQEQFDQFMQQVRRVLPGEPGEPGRAHRHARPPGGRRAAADGLAHAGSNAPSSAG